MRGFSYGAQTIYEVKAIVKSDNPHCRRRRVVVVLMTATIFASIVNPALADSRGRSRQTVVLSRSTFDTNRDGFSFSNWSEQPAQGTGINLLIQLFGRPSVCTNADSESACNPLDRASTFSRDVENELARGRCEGMVVLAAKLHAQGGPAASTLSVENVENEITYWWGSQMLPAVSRQSKATRAMQPSRLVDEIRRGIQNGATSTLGLYVNGSGHSVLPIAMVRRGDVVAVSVYESNTPRREQKLWINLRTDTWRYSPQGDDGMALFSWTHKGPGGMDVIPLAIRQPQSTSYFSVLSTDE